MQKSELKCLYWNIHGISSQILGEKKKDPRFLEIIKGFDVIAISELHTKSNIQIPGFHLKKQKFRPKKHKGPKIGGGIAVFVNQEVASNFRLIQNDNADSIWIKTSDNETRLAFYYCSPEKKESMVKTIGEKCERFAILKFTHEDTREVSNADSASKHEDKDEDHLGMNNVMLCQ